MKEFKLIGMDTYKISDTFTYVLSGPKIINYFGEFRYTINPIISHAIEMYATYPITEIEEEERGGYCYSVGKE